MAHQAKSTDKQIDKQIDTDAREKLIQVAGELFSQHGLDGVSTREIAAKAELNVSLISYYFGGKEGLYKTVIHEFALTMHKYVQKYLEELTEEKVEAKTFIVNITQGLVAVTKLKIGLRHLSVILHREMLSGLPYARETHENVFNELANETIAVFKRAQRKGILRKDINPQVLFLTLIFTIENYVLQRQLETKFWKSCPQVLEDTDEFVIELVKIIFEGVLK